MTDYNLDDFSTLKPTIIRRENIKDSSVESQSYSDISENSALKILKVMIVCIDTINVSSMLHRCHIVASLVDRLVIFITILMNHQFEHCRLD